MTWIQRAHVYEYNRDGVKIEFTATYTPSDGYARLVHSVQEGQPTTDDLARIYADIANDSDLIEVVAFIDDDGNRIEKGEEGFTHDGNIYALENIGDYFDSWAFRDYANRNPQEVEIFSYWATVDGDTLDNMGILEDVYSYLDYSDIVDYVQSGDVDDYEYKDGDDVAEYFEDNYTAYFLMPDGVLLDEEPTPEEPEEPTQAVAVPSLAPEQIDALAENLARMVDTFPALKTELIARGWVVTRL